MQYYCGLDLGSRNCHVCVMDESGTRLVDRKVDNELVEIVGLLKPFQAALECVVESTFNWYWLVDGLEDAGFRVCLAHTLGLAMITKAKVKTDRRDAYMLAKLLKGDMIPTGYIYPRALRPARDLVRRRGRIVAQRAACYGAIRRLLYQQGLLNHTGNSVKNIHDECLEEWFEHPLVQMYARHQVEQVRLYSTQIREIERQILSGVKDRAPFQNLTSIPGIGPILALSILFEVGDIARFPTARDFSSYCRVVPGIAQSSGVARRGRGSKQGNPHLKCALTEAAVMAKRYYTKVRRYHTRCLERHQGPGRMLVANNAVAHKLAVAVYHVLRDNVAYREELLFGN